MKNFRLALKGRPFPALEYENTRVAKSWYFTSGIGRRWGLSIFVDRLHRKVGQ